MGGGGAGMDRIPIVLWKKGSPHGMHINQLR